MRQYMVWSDNYFIFYLSYCHKQAEHNGSHTNTKDTVNEKPTEEAEDDVRPGVPGVETHKLTNRYV